jgi:hypothetical protein
VLASFDLLFRLVLRSVPNSAALTIESRIAVADSKNTSTYIRASTCEKRKLQESWAPTTLQVYSLATLMTVNVGSYDR